MGEVISLEAERIKRDAKKLMQAENWLNAHQSETQRFLDYRRDQAFEHVTIIWASDETEDGTRDGV
jgi:hypothetical protein